MYKLILLFVILFVSNTDVNANTEVKPSEKEDLCQFEYWNAFSQTFNKTADYWEAESAALEAEDKAENRTGIEEWLKENSLENSKNHTESSLKI